MQIKMQQLMLLRRIVLPYKLLIVLFLFLLIVTFASSSSVVHSTNAIKKNVLFVIVDDLRPALGCYDDMLSITPHIDRLAKKSVVFQQTYAQQALCAPSRNSMLTSRRPDTLHLYDFYSYWRKTVGNFTTLPQYFKEHGYNTFSIGKVFHPGKSSNFNDDYPFSWSNETYHPPTERFMNAPVCPDKHTQTYQQNVICPVNVKFQPDQSLPDIQSIDKAIDFLRTYNDSVKPFFLAIGLHKPHIPLRFPIKYQRYHQIDKFQKDNFIYVPFNLPTVAFNPYNDIRQRDDVKKFNISFPFGPMPKLFAWKFRQAYYSSVTYIDNLIGKLLKSVNLTNTIILLTSDHGYALGEHAEWAKYTNYEIGVRVPLIIYSPDYQYRLAHNVHILTELIDVFPTVVDLAKLPSLRTCRHKRFKQKTCTQGKSLLPFFNINYQQYMMANKSDDFAISQYPRPNAYPTVDSDRPRLKHIKIMGYSLRFKNYRYTIWLEFNSRTFKRNWFQHFGEELYDHSIDPDELINLFNRSEFHHLKEFLKQMLREKLDDIQ